MRVNRFVAENISLTKNYFYFNLSHFYFSDIFLYFESELHGERQRGKQGGEKKRNGTPFVGVCCCRVEWTTWNALLFFWLNSLARLLHRFDNWLLLLQMIFISFDFFLYKYVVLFTGRKILRHKLFTWWHGVKVKLCIFFPRIKTIQWRWTTK